MKQEMSLSKRPLKACQSSINYPVLWDDFLLSICSLTLIRSKRSKGNSLLDPKLHSGKKYTASGQILSEILLLKPEKKKEILDLLSVSNTLLISNLVQRSD